MECLPSPELKEHLDTEYLKAGVTFISRHLCGSRGQDISYSILECLVFLSDKIWAA